MIYYEKINYIENIIPTNPKIRKIKEFLNYEK